jgi:hypothetical protein
MQHIPDSTIWAIGYLTNILFCRSDFKTCYGYVGYLPTGNRIGKKMGANIEFTPNPDFPEEFAQMIKKAALEKVEEQLEQFEGGASQIHISTDKLEEEAKRIATDMQDKFHKMGG